MKSIIFAALAFTLSTSSAFAAQKRICQDKGITTAFRAILDDREANFADMSGLELKAAGVALKKQVGSQVTLEIDIISTQVLGQGKDQLISQTHDTVSVEMTESPDSGCAVKSSKIISGGE